MNSGASRHVVVHAYELDFDPDKLKLILKYARQIREHWKGAVNAFIQTVAKLEDINP